MIPLRFRPLLGALIAGTVPLLAAAMGACSGFGTEPSEAVAIEIDTPVLPSVVAGDQMRDSLGAVAPLAARAFNANNELIADAPIRFFAVDTGAAVVDSLTGVVTGKRNGQISVIASVGKLQSSPLQVTITSRPDTVYALDTLRDTVQYSLGIPAANIDTLRVFVGHDTAIAGVDTAVAVSGYLVRYRIVEPAGLSRTDTLGTLLLGDDQRRPSTADTTGTDGVARRFLRIARQPPVPDSVVVEVVVSRPDATPVPGSPIRYTTIVVKP
ncbi:MAG TPA: hypothetical protein VFS44_06180 [Gemmatimonadaceae bacterium]|nr:hypothetical protein [Gemmatimonadaceae bacterium]